MVIQSQYRPGLLYVYELLDSFDSSICRPESEYHHRRVYIASPVRCIEPRSRAIRGYLDRRNEDSVLPREAAQRAHGWINSNTPQWLWWLPDHFISRLQ